MPYMDCYFISDSYGSIVMFTPESATANYAYIEFLNNNSVYCFYETQNKTRMNMSYSPYSGSNQIGFKVGNGSHVNLNILWIYGLER